MAPARETCPGCHHAFSPPGADCSLVACPSCGRLFVRDDAPSIDTSLAGPDDPPRSVQVITLSREFRDRFGLSTVLGSGGYGMVFQATHRPLGKQVAVKILTQTRDEAGVRRFINEAKFLASIRHPNVVGVIELGEVRGLPYIVSELVTGGTLLTQLASEKRRPLAQALSVTFDALAGLEACHEKGIVHRDLKPANVLLTETGSAKIADLGLAKLIDFDEGLTRTGVLVGTPRYLSPEQIGGAPAAVSMDIYAMATILYEMLAGEPVFSATNLHDLLRCQMAESPRSLIALAPTVPVSVAEVIHSALAKDPAQRPATARGLADALRQAMMTAQGPTTATKETGPTPRPAPVRPSAIARAPAQGGRIAHWTTVTIGRMVASVAIVVAFLALRESAKTRIASTSTAHAWATMPGPESPPVPATSLTSGQLHIWMERLAPIDRRRGEYQPRLRVPDERLGAGDVRSALRLIQGIQSETHRDVEAVRVILDGLTASGTSPRLMPTRELVLATHAASLVWALMRREDGLRERCSDYEWAIREGKDSLLYVPEIAARDAAPRQAAFLDPLRRYLLLFPSALERVTRGPGMGRDVLEVLHDFFDAVSEARLVPLTVEARRRVDEWHRELDVELGRSGSANVNLAARAAQGLFRLAWLGASSRELNLSLQETRSLLGSLRDKMDTEARPAMDGWIAELGKYERH